MKHLIAKLEPVEKKKFQQDYQHTLDKLRERNAQAQAFARRRLEETVDTHEWAMKRKMGKREEGRKRDCNSSCCFCSFFTKVFGV